MKFLLEMFTNNNNYHYNKLFLIIFQFNIPIFTELKT